MPTTPEDGPRRRKRVTRQSALVRRDALSPGERERASAAIAARALGELPQQGTIALYAAKGTEAATIALDAMLRARGQVVAYPRVVDGTRVLAFHVAEREALVASVGLGILEPRAEALPIALDAIAAFVIPGVAFDRAGGRVGWGRGYYDATLASSDAPRIGLCFECQLLDEIPREPHDARLDVIVTEAAAYLAAR
ncbi:MAG: 5-formyltetrahydrofolate cyclo-ligase [Proteobacteria bacterium]|nr:5-formyltetrahydrofolate cyclo-ligase [Pseudomonadota bacterium]